MRRVLILTMSASHQRIVSAATLSLCRINTLTRRHATAQIYIPVEYPK